MRYESGVDHATLLQDSGPDCLDDRLCRWVWELTGQAGLAEVTQLTITPLRIMLVLGLALIARQLLHRAIRRLVRRATTGALPAFLRPLPERSREAGPGAAGAGPGRRRQRAEAIGSVLRSSVTVAVFSVASMLMLSELGVNLAPLLAGAGIVGVALGFGAQSLVRDLLAGLFMLMEDQFGIGDVVDLGEASGVVEAVGLRITTLRDMNGALWYVPNGEIRRVANRSQGWAVVVVDIPIGYEPVAEATAALRIGAERLAADPDLAADLLEPPEVLGVDQVTVEGAVVRTIVKSTTDSQWKVGRELRRRQTEALEEAGLAARIAATRAYRPDAGPAGGSPVE
jgi:small conductance mechanosensitive channel